MKCETPFDLTASKNNDSTLWLSWAQIINVANTSIDYYEAEVREVNTSTWHPAIFPYGNLWEICLYTPAQAGKCYEWRVRTICISPDSTRDNSAWATTVYSHGASQCPTSSNPVCNVPDSLATGMSNDTTAFLRWLEMESSNGSSFYDAEYREIPLSNWTKAFFPYGDDSEMALIQNAKRGSCYEWRVRALCPSDNITDTSAWIYKTQNTGAATCPTAPPPSPPAPAPVINPNFSYTIEACSPGQVSFVNNTTVTGTALKSMEWDLGDGHKNTTENPLHSYEKPGNYAVTLTVTDTAGKAYSKTHSVTITALRLEFAKAGDDQVVCGKDPIILQATGGETYSWSPCSRLSNCNISNPTVDVGTNEVYIVTVTNKDGCVDSDTVSVKFIDPAIKLNVPNAFTPNNDGVNDLFRPLVSLQGNVNAEWKLFNRFGNLIFSTNNNTDGWNGSYKGQPQPPGNYTYMINFKTENSCPARQYKGTVLLIR